MGFLRDYQEEAVNKLQNGNILVGGVGSGKSRTGLYYYFMKQGGKILDDDYVPMSNPKPLYIITTAKKRDSLEWQKELSYFGLDLEHNKIIIDSWNNIHKYISVSNSFFLLDEQRLVGKGAWTKSFYKISKNNEWILLTATPGDNYNDYVPVFIANGFFKNRTEFETNHVILNPYTKYKSVMRYVGTARLDRLKNRIIVQMNYHHDIDVKREWVLCDYDRIIYKDMIKNRWNIWDQKPFQNAADFCYGLRKVVNSDPSRAEEVLNIFNNHGKIIIFYNFDYELEILKSINYGSGVEIGELNGHRHDSIPESDRWVYLVNYIAGAEAWNCISTNAMIFYSLSYSYKGMTQAAGRIDRLNTPFRTLYYYYLTSTSSMDLAIRRALRTKKDFNMRGFSAK